MVLLELSCLELCECVSVSVSVHMPLFDIGLKLYKMFSRL